jgi:hypothetical protein
VTMRQRFTRRRVTAVVAALMLAAMAAGCASSGSPSAASGPAASGESQSVSAAPTANVATSATGAPDPCDQGPVFEGKESIDAYKAACPNYKAQSAGPVQQPSRPAPAASVQALGVLGATDADWNRAHQADTAANTPDSAYDPMARQYGGLQDRFAQVNHIDGRVASFDLAYPPGTNVKEASREAMTTLPLDATHGPLVLLDICAAMQIESQTLQRETGSPDAVVFFSSGPADDHYSRDAVADSEIAANQTVPDQYC